MRRMRIQVGDVTIHITILDTPTGDALYQALPFNSTANLWGEEVYFSTPVSMEQEPTAREVLLPGEVAYWPPGNAITLCYGQTPVSRGDELRLASPGNVWGHAEEPLTVLRDVCAGVPVLLEREPL